MVVVRLPQYRLSSDSRPGDWLGRQRDQFCAGSLRQAQRGRQDGVLEGIGAHRHTVRKDKPRSLCSQAGPVRPGQPAGKGS